jgi:hypothetical protein
MRMLFDSAGDLDTAWRSQARQAHDDFSVSRRSGAK